MKTVLLVSNLRAHVALYEKRLGRHFCVRFAPKVEGGSGRVDAIIYDIAAEHTSIDLRWLAHLEVPVVVLTPEDAIQLPEGPTRKVLTYPVRADQIIRALAELGVKSEGGDW